MTNLLRRNRLGMAGGSALPQMVGSGGLERHRRALDGDAEKLLGLQGCESLRLIRPALLFRCRRPRR